MKRRQKARRREQHDYVSDDWASSDALEQMEALEDEIEALPLDDPQRGSLEEKLTRWHKFRAEAQVEVKTRVPTGGDRVKSILAHCVVWLVGAVAGLIALRHGLNPFVAALCVLFFVLAIGVPLAWFAAMLRPKIRRRDAGRNAQLARVRAWRRARLALVFALAPATLPVVYASVQRIAIAHANSGHGPSAQIVSAGSDGSEQTAISASQALALALAKRAAATIASASEQKATVGAHALAMDTLAAATDLGGRPLNGVGELRMEFNEANGAAVAASVAFPGHLGHVDQAAGLWVSASPSSAALHASDPRGVAQAGVWFVPFYGDAACKTPAVDFVARDQGFSMALARAGQQEALRNWTKAREQNPVFDESVRCVGEPVAVSGLSIADRSAFSFSSDWLDQASDFAEVSRAASDKQAGLGLWARIGPALAAKTARMSIDEDMMDQESREAP